MAKQQRGGVTLNEQKTLLILDRPEGSAFWDGKQCWFVIIMVTSPKTLWSLTTLAVTSGLRRLVTGLSPWGRCSFPGQQMRDLWWIMCHRNMFLSTPFLPSKYHSTKCQVERSLAFLPLSFIPAACLNIARSLWLAGTAQTVEWGTSRRPSCLWTRTGKILLSSKFPCRA